MTKPEDVDRAPVHAVVMRSDAERVLRKMVEVKQELDKQWASLHKSIGLETESPFGIASWKPITMLIECVEIIVGDEIGTVSWYVWDNECGRKAMEHSLPDGSMRKVRTIDDLLDVLGF
jgi:benzoyl-CoA reductase/2-hydroxyglutaryl-CoA dehydratase subunit BcrC/BadD/HgdB